MALLDVEKLSVGYSRQVILHDISLHVDEGEIVAIFGGNGSGKSTLLRAIFGLLPHTIGNLIFDGSDLTSASVLMRQRAGMSYLFQGRRVFGDLTVAENIEVSMRGVAREVAMNSASEIFSKFPSVTLDFRQEAKELSGGEAKILAFACAILSRPRLLLLDEPTASLSSDAAISLLDILSEYRRLYGVAILMVEHNREQAMSVADRAFLIANGRIEE